MRRITNWVTAQRSSLALASQALRAWDSLQVLAAAAAAVSVAVVVGLATVLIPNPIFGREIAPPVWNYPVWIVTSVLMGMLIATYLRRPSPVAADGISESAAYALTGPNGHASAEQRSARVGTAAGVLAWFAVGCPVCNKIAVVALGYTGALTWFAPFQPVLAGTALLLLVIALVWRLRGQVICPVSPRSEAMSH